MLGAGIYRVLLFWGFLVCCQTAPVVPSSGVSLPVRQILSVSPSLIPGDSRDQLNVTLLGIGFNPDPNANLTCHFRGGQNYAAHGVRDTNATLLSPNAVVCHFPPSGVLPLDSKTDLKLNGNESWSCNSHAVLSIRTFVEVALDKRPYLSNETGSAVLLVSVDADAASSFEGTRGMKQLNVCRTIHYSISNTTHKCDVWNILPNKTALSIPLNLGDLSTVEATDVEVDVSFVCATDTSECDRGAMFHLATKRRRLLVAPVKDLHTVSSFVAVDHKRSMLTKDGVPLLTNGFYIHCITEYLWGNLSLGRCLDDITELAMQGMNHVQIYSMEGLNGTDLEVVVKHCERHGMLFGWSLVGEVIQLLNTSGAGNSTANWAKLVAKMDLVRSSPSLLGYYICDDCDRADVFPVEGMAWVYTVFKKIDPFHITLGAPWTSPWSTSAWSEAGGSLVLDVCQVENYLPEPSYLIGGGNDASKNRIGMAFEPMINSPPMYLLDSYPGSAYNRKGNKSYPAVLEASLSWMAAITYGAVSQLNFIIEDACAGGRNAPGECMNDPAHINSMGSYARASRKIWMALLPDVTVAGNALEVVRLSGSTCDIPASSVPDGTGTAPKFAERRGQSVAVKGFRDQRGDRHFCGYLVVVNLCPNVTDFTLRVSGVPVGVVKASHEFEATYDVRLSGCASNATLGLCEKDFQDTLIGYGSAVYSLGCA